MKKSVLIVASVIAIAAVSACSKPEPAPEAAQSAAASEAPAATWTPAIPPPGNYETTTSDGKLYSTVSLEPDNSYSRVPAQGANEAGIVKMTDGKLCFDPSGKDNPERCYSITQPAADGSFTVTNAKGETLTVKPKAK